MKKILLTTVITGLIYALPMKCKSVLANPITKANYDNLKIGMTYHEVKKILGIEGKIYTEYNSPNLENFGVAYRWINNDGTGIVAVFNSENKLIKFTAQNLNTNSFGINREAPVVTSLNWENFLTKISLIPLAQWIACLQRMRGVPGSNPGGSIGIFVF